MAVEISETRSGETRGKECPELQLMYLYIIVNNAWKVVVIW
jgi:hypothetical protein